MKKIISILLSIVLVVGIAPAVSAAEYIILPEEFKQNKWVGGIDKSDQYYLDMADPGIMDMSGAKTINEMANGLFKWQVNIVKFTCVLVNFAASFDFVEMFGTKIAPYQTNLKVNLFDTLILVFIALAFLGMAGVMLKRNYPEMMSRVTQIVVLCVAAAILSSNSLPLISLLNNISEGMSQQIIKSMAKTDGIYGDENYSATTLDSLWNRLIHQPWKMLEFDQYTPTDDLEKRLLDENELPKGSEKRQEEINEIKKEAKKANAKFIPFNEGMGTDRFWFLLGNFFVIIPLCAFDIVIEAARAVLQLIIGALVLLGMVVLLLAIVPWFGGMKLLEKWGMQILYFSVLSVLLRFVASFIYMVNDIIYLWAIAWGWGIAILFQVIFLASFIVFGKQIFGFIFKLPGKMLTKNGMDLTKIHARDVQMALSTAGSSVSDGAQNVQSNVHNKMVEVGSGIYGAGARSLTSMLDLGSSARDKISDFTGSFSSSTHDDRGEQNVKRPTLDISVDSPAAGRAKAASSESAGRATAAPSGSAEPRPNLSGTENSRSGAAASTHVTNPVSQPNTGIVDSNKESAYKSVSQPPSLHVAGSSVSAEQTQTSVEASERVPDYADWNQRPKLAEEPTHSAGESQRTGEYKESPQSQEKRPTRHERPEVTTDMNDQNQVPHKRPEAVKEFNFDMGSFEPQARPEQKASEAKRPVLEEVS